MQTAPAFNPQASYSMGVPNAPSYFPNQPYTDPRMHGSYVPNTQPNYGYNYQPYYSNQFNQPYQSYHGYSRYPQHHQQTAQYINPAYQYQFDPRYSHNLDARYHQRIQTYNVPTNYSNKTGRLPTQPIRNTRNPNILTPAPQIKQVIYQQEPLNIPQSVRNVQYIPHLHRYMDYVEERMKIPVEKYYTDYYQVEHVTDFVPRQYEDTVVEMVPEQIIRYRLQYIPVERKIVHLPKKQLYDENGLYKGIGNLTDKVHIDQAAIGLVNQAQVKSQNQISRTIYERNLKQTKGLDQSLVDAIGKDIQNQTKNEAIVNRNVYDNIRNNIGTPVLSRQQISRTIYEDARGKINAPTGYGYSGQMISDMALRNLGQSKSRVNYSAQGSRVSRRKTNFVTSDGYFPNYDQELRNLDTSF